MSIKLENMRRRQAIIDLYLNKEVTKEFMIETITSLNELEAIELQKENPEPVSELIKKEPDSDSSVKPNNEETSKKVSNPIMDILNGLESKQTSEQVLISGSVVKPGLGTTTPVVTQTVAPSSIPEIILSTPTEPSKSISDILDELDPKSASAEPSAKPVAPAESSVAEPSGTNTGPDETSDQIETYQVPGTGDSELNAQVLSSIDPNVAEAEALTHLTQKELKITKRRAVSSEKKAKFKYSGKKVLLKSLYSLIPLLTILSSGYFSYVLSNFSSNNGLGVDLSFIPVTIAGAVSALYITSMSAIKKKEYDNPKYKWNFLKKLQDALNAEGPKVIYEERKKYRETVDAEVNRRGKAR